MRISSVLLAVLALVFVPAVALCQAPQTYSLTTKGGVGGVIVQKVDRDGAKISIEKTVPKSPYAPGTHSRRIFDFTAQKMWYIDLEGDAPCVVVSYTSSFVPSESDPISGAEDLRNALAKHKQVLLRSETVNGIPTKLYEFTDPQTKEKMRIFFDEKYNFPVKTIFIIDGKEEVADQITSLSYTKPPATLFVPPQNCRVQAGTTSATGGQVQGEMNVASASAEVNMADGKVVQQAVQKPAPVSAAKPAAPAAVTSVRAVGVTPAHYTGAAPAAYEFTFALTASGPLEANYTLVNQAGIAWESGTVRFDAAGTKEVKVPVKVGVGNGQHWEGSAFLEVFVGTAKTRSAPLKVSSDAKAK